MDKLFREYIHMCAYTYMIPARGPRTVFYFFVCYATFAMQSLQCNFCTAIFALQFLLWALQTTNRNRCMKCVHLLLNQQSWISCFCIAFHCSEATEATSGLPDNQPCSFEKIKIVGFALLFIALRLLRLPRGYLTTSPIHLSKSK